MKKQDARFQKYLRVLQRDSFLYEVSKDTVNQFELAEQKSYALTFGPILFSYVTWVLTEAHKKGHNRLYFLARDAYPMYVTAKYICEEKLLGFDMDVRYLRVSRFSLRLPEYHLQKEDCLERIFLSGIDVSLYRILKRADLSVEEMHQICQEIGYEKSLEEVLNRAQIQHLKTRVYQAVKDKSTTLLEMIEKHSKECFETTIGYLRQEGLLEDVSFGVVDSGWVGSIQKSLQNLLATQKPDISVDGYYFGLYEVPKNCSGCKYYTFYFSPTKEIVRKSKFSNCLFETVYSENCGMVKKYKKDNGVYEPVLSNIENPNTSLLETNDVVLYKYLENVKKYKRDYLTFASGQKKVLVKTVEKLCALLMAKPTTWEAEYYGKMLFSDDLDDSHMRKAANELSQKEIRDLRVISKLLIALGISKKIIHESAWIEGTIVNGKKRVTMNLFFSYFAKVLTYVRQTIKMKRYEEINV